MHGVASNATNGLTEITTTPGNRTDTGTNPLQARLLKMTFFFAMSKIKFI